MPIPPRSLTQRRGASCRRARESSAEASACACRDTNHAHTNRAPRRRLIKSFLRGTTHCPRSISCAKIHDGLVSSRLERSFLVHANEPCRGVLGGMTMTMRRPTCSWLGWVFGLTLAVVISVPTPSRAQSTTDPYNPWNWTYNPYTVPMSPDANPAIPNQARSEALGTGTRFFDQSLDGYFARDNLFGRGGGRFSAGGSVAGLEDQSYRPNRNDGDFYRDQSERNAKFFEAQREKDPKKRAQLMKELEAENRRAALGLSNLRSRSGSKASSAAPLSTRRSGTPLGIRRGGSTTRSDGASATRSGTTTTTRPRAAATTPRSRASSALGGSSSLTPTRPSAGARSSTNRELSPAETLRRAEDFGRTPASRVPAARRPRPAGMDDDSR
jgi:hypothetical protein